MVVVFVLIHTCRGMHVEVKDNFCGSVLSFHLVTAASLLFLPQLCSWPCKLSPALAVGMLWLHTCVPLPELWGIELRQVF